MKSLTVFASKFGAQIALNPEFILQKNQRYYLLNPQLRKVARADFFYAGLYLGKVKNSMFFPSFNFLNMLVRVATNKMVLDHKAAWLFICGRDLFRKGILSVQGSQRKGDFVLLINEFDECLGFGMIVGDFKGVKSNEVVVRNVLDVGDFLRREN
ncbi:MAG TPA: PUA domain-containing protein [Candidatus Nanoarchaeia archaeon]|nr:PUA domain-containing protein [Candidatus Nanoarchaeia archaeon]